MISRKYKIGKEASAQICVVHWFRMTWPQYRRHLIRIGNEGKRSKIGHELAKKSGLVLGASDLFLAIPNDLYHGLWIEMKEPDFNRKNKSEHYTRQIDFIKSMKRLGYDGHVAVGFEEAQSIITTHMMHIKD